MRHEAEVVESFAALARELAYAAFNSAVTSLDYDRYEKDADLELADLWEDYWLASYGPLYFSAFYAVDVALRASAALRAIAARASHVFADTLANVDGCWDVVEQLPLLERNSTDRFLDRIRFCDGVDARAIPRDTPFAQIRAQMQADGFR